MDHHGCRLLAVLRDVVGAEAAWKIEIDLRRAALPFAPNRIAQGVFELRAIESAFAWIDGGLGAAPFERLKNTGQGRLGPIPSSSEPTRFSGRVDNLITMSSNPKSL